MLALVADGRHTRTSAQLAVVSVVTKRVKKIEGLWHVGNARSVWHFAAGARLAFTEPADLRSAAK
jgi:hypothetical protein